MKRNKDSSPPPERKEREKKVKTSDQTSARSVADPDSTPGSTADLSVDSERRLLTNRSPSSSSAEFKSMVETSTSLIDHGLVRAAAMATDTLSLADNSNHNTNTNVTAATDIDNQATSDRKLDSDEDNIEYGEHRHSDMHALQRMYTDEEDEDSDEMMDEMQRQMMNMMEPPTPVWSLRCGRCHATICPTAMSVYLLADEDVHLYSSDSKSNTICCVGSSRKIDTCDCRIIDIACLSCRNGAPPVPSHIEPPPPSPFVHMAISNDYHSGGRHADSTNSTNSNNNNDGSGSRELHDQENHYDYAGFDRLTPPELALSPSLPLPPSPSSYSSSSSSSSSSSQSPLSSFLSVPTSMPTSLPSSSPPSSPLALAHTETKSRSPSPSPSPPLSMSSSPRSQTSPTSHAPSHAPSHASHTSAPAILGYNVVEACDECLSGGSNGHFWMFHDSRVAALARPNLFWMEGETGFQVHAAILDYDWSADVHDDYVDNHTAPAA